MSDPFHAPSFSPRLRYLCSYLTEKGWEVEVHTEKADAIPFAHEYPIYEHRIYTGSRVDWAIKAVFSLLIDWRRRHFENQVRYEIRDREFDAIFCTTFSTFPLGAAVSLAQERQIPLLCDIRDLDEQVPGAQYQRRHGLWARPFIGLYRAVQIRRRNEALREAQIVTTVSPWHVDFLRPLCKQVELVYNGYDPALFYPSDEKCDRFLISYIGKIYPFQDITPVERVVERLQKEGLPVELNIHSPQHNPISIDAVPDEIRQSSIMIVLTGRETHGMMTTKFFEALGCEKPVLCVPSDKGLLQETIIRTNAGIATDSEAEIEQFIRVKLQEWYDCGYTHQAVEKPARAVFSRRLQSEQINQYLCQLTNPL